MPGMKGFEAAQNIRQLDVDVRLRMLTAKMLVSSRQKPVTQTAMRDVIDYFLARP